MKLAYIIQCTALAAMVAHADEAAIAPKCLYSVAETSQETKVKPEKVVTVSAGGVVSVAGSGAEYPCVDFVPANGVWDLSPWGHIETQVKNTSDMPISVNMRVDQTDPFQSNTEIAYLKPGESRTLKVIFGYQYGFKPGPKLDPSNINLVKLFVGGKSACFAETPKLMSYKFNAEDYARIIFGFPVWAGNVTPPIRTFIKENDLQGKKIAAFACQGGAGAEKAFDKLKEALGIGELEAELILNDPKARPDEANEKKIFDFCESIKDGLRG